MAPVQVGTAHSQPGKLVYGRFETVALPTGESDYLPVIIAQGQAGGGPVLWLTASIHGNEYDGVAVIHRLVTPDLLPNLTGTVVAIPTLNPAGLRTGQRSPYYLRGKDPNRLFPTSPNLTRSPRVPYQPALELAYARLFERIDATADYLLDLHDYGIRAMPFVFRDPVLYREARDRPRAEKLQHTVGEMLDALGLTVVNEYPSAEYLKLNLHRTVSGATLNAARIPAATIEIGGQHAFNGANITAVTSSIRNMMRWGGMLPGPPEPVEHIPIFRPGYPLQRTTHPRAPTACIVQHVVQPGDQVQAGDPVAHLADIYGRPVGTPDGLLRTEQAGIVLGFFPGIAFYPNDSILGMAVRGTDNMVIRV
ncbi:MAG: succinylglutamate desuccinylase/aspartoacylase family protein [Anaerolineae bacterium]|nr:succinylglutamate desuccinylase/aspartoacylase family protein [Anaerolineae bacterium]